MNVTILDATEKWVGTFNAIPREMIRKLMDYESHFWSEVTLPQKGDKVYIPMLGAEGEITEYGEDCKVFLDNGETVTVSKLDFEVVYNDPLPIWGTLWSMGESLDERWLDSEDGLKAMSECGFRIFEHEEFGYFFGIDGAGYDFYEAHWIPLYKARGLHWHSEEE